MVLPAVVNGKKVWSVDETTRAMKARELHRVLDHASDAIVAKTIERGSFLECGVTAKDVRNAAEMFGECEGCLKAKRNETAAVPTTHARADQPGRILRVDIYFIVGPKGTRSPYLIAVEEFANFVCSMNMPSKSTSSIMQALKAMVMKFRGWRMDVRTIRSDSEGALIACTSGLNEMGIQFVAVAPGRHERLAERTIQTIKKKMSASIAGIEYPLPRRFYSKLNDWVVSSMNIVVNARSDLSPREVIIGTKIETSLHLKFAFGDIVISQIPQKPGHSADIAVMRAFIGIVVQRDFTSTGNVRLFLLDEQELVWRSAASTRRIAISDVIRNKLKVMADVDKLTVPNDALVQQLGDNGQQYIEVSAEAENVVEEGIPVVGGEEADRVEEHIGDQQNEEVVISQQPQTSEEIVVVEQEGESKESESTQPAEVEEDGSVIRDVPEEPPAAATTIAAAAAPATTESLPIPIQQAAHSYNLRETRSNWRNYISVTLVEVGKAMSLIYWACVALSQVRKENPDQAVAAATTELQQMEEMKVFHPVLFSTLNYDDKKHIISCTMLIDEKYDAAGKWEKTKGRLAAGGNQQLR